MFKILNPELVSKIKAIYTPDEQKIIDAGFNTEKRKPTFRINTLKANVENTLKNLDENGIKYFKSDVIDNCYILDKGIEKDLWNTGAYKAGYIYIQGLSSQIPVNLMDINPNQVILDITAAPGSKTSQIADKLGNTGGIVACDNNQIRIDKLNYTLNKQGVKNVKVVKTDARNLGKELNNQQFDHILFDAPCSAEGRMNLTREKSYAYWKQEVVNKNYNLQKNILKSVVPLLKEGGSLIYSTCTLSPEENEGIVHLILCNYPELQIEEININSKYTKPGILEFGKQRFKKEVSKSIRILPSIDNEGFFVAKFIKN